MSIFLSIVLAVQLLSAISVVVLVLLQHGKGADMGASFGAGASGSLFGSTGSANFLSRTTGVLAAIFFISTLGLAFLGNQRTTTGGSSVLDRVAPAQTKDGVPKVEAPKVDAPKVDAPKADMPKVDASKTDVPKVDAPKIDAPKLEVPKLDVKPAESKPAQNSEVPK
jgi:preprotein translocase subunit SecG